MDDFLIQFLAQAWRGVALIGGLLLLAFIVARRNAGKKEAEIRRRKDAQNPELAQKTANKSNQKSSKKAQSKKAVAMPQAEFAEELVGEDVHEEEFIVSSKGSIFDDEDFFPADDEADLVGDYPVSELLTDNEEPVSPPIDDEEDAVDLASLLSGMVQEDIPQKNYHRIADTPVAVKLVTKNLAIAKELLTILRDERDARLMVQVGEVAYRSLLGEKATRAFFTDTMGELSGIVLTPDGNPPESVDIARVAPNKMSTKAIDVQVASGGETTAREMISILRDEADGHLIIQIGNTGYRTLADNPKAKAGFSKIMKELSTAITTEDDNPPIVETKPIASAPKSTQSSSSYFDDEENKTSLPGDIRVATMDDMPDAYKVDRFGRVKVKKVEEKVEEINIAEAIEAYLQYKIQQTPQYQNRGIHIRSAFGGGVRIEVDGKSYEFVDEVAEDDAREFIQQAIAEWQERH